MADRPPLISPAFCDVPTQRLYIVSFVALVQSYKVFQYFDFIWSGSSSEDWTLWLYWTLIDTFLIAILIPSLRVPRLKFGVFQRFLIISIFLSVNWLFVGNWHVGWSLIWSLFPNSIKSWFDYRTALTEYKVRLQDVINPSSHILGKHTIHVLPFSTAKLNPSTQCFCLPSITGSTFVSIPILFNNSIPNLLQYSVLNFTTGEKTLHNLTRAQLRPLSKQKKPQKSLEDWLEDEEDNWSSTTANQAQASQQPRSRSQQSISQDGIKLSPTQYLYNLEIFHTGVIRLERVLDEDTMDIRIARTEALVVQCPKARFGPKSDRVEKKVLSWSSLTNENKYHRCVGEAEDFGLVVEGLAPLSLTYQQIINGQAQQANLEGIAPNEFVTPLISIDPATLSERLLISHRPEYTWAESKAIEIPMNVSLTVPGKHIYQLESLKDACGHSVHFAANRQALTTKKASQQDSIDKKIVHVHPKSQISFIGCGNTEEPLRLLKGQSVTLRLRIQDNDSDFLDPPWTVGISYSPFNSSANLDSVVPSPWRKELVLHDHEKVFHTSDAGVYEITSLSGKYCQGDILVPSTCLVVEQPLPEIDLNFTTITDQCSGEIGLRANFLLKGKPPFELHYLISQSGRSPQRKSKVIQYSRDELFIQPDSPGQFEYSFIRLDDQYYQDVKIIGKTIKQTVHPLAQAKFIQGGRDKIIWSCSGETVKAEIELKGAPPYTVAYQILGEAPQVVHGILSTHTTLDINIPKRYIKKGGNFIVSLISITDGNGCMRNLTVPDLNIEIHRTKPTLKFYGTDNSRKLFAREGDFVSLPMRLTGNGPWTIKYSLNNSDEIVEQVVHGSNDELMVNKAGKYTLQAVHDRYCPGAVENPTFEVEWLAKPSLMVSLHNSGELLRGVWIKPAVCELAEDSIELTLEGTPPFSIEYSVAYKPAGKGNKINTEFKTIQLLKTTGTLPLNTAEPGDYTYTIHGLSDRQYSTPSSSGLLNAHRSGNIQIKQEVFALPQGTIKSLPQTTYCVDETLAYAKFGKGVKIEFTGKAPFDLQVEVKNQVTQIEESFNIHSETYSTMLNVPYKFRSAVPHSVSLKSLQDANRCSSVSLHNSVENTPIIIEVAEIASIKPVSHKPYFCVGESLDFLLRGSPPWLIKYEFNSKKSAITVTSKEEPKFSRLAQEPGVFKIISIAHQEDLCTAKVELEAVIKPIPTVKISSGRNYIEDIREGDQSEIIFTFEGTPPFSFTYTRSLPEDRFNEKKVLETHTITDIHENTYSIFVREEGTWSVTYIQDAFCSFPTLSLNEKK
ncbi:hypothetical protein O181_017453 [Austropuccinia psidii MF-1]|uniref:Nucleoporin Pom152 n=1 Tax=Austropuccinia psidii MF-1 TaxID=1389203 RepID=A0A9Q3C642_9BASI|nr:hypothetical protein [Austropuccinia psidii MF-1]